jgi:hypothetical protein
LSRRRQSTAPFREDGPGRGPPDTSCRGPRLPASFPVARIRSTALPLLSVGCPRPMPTRRCPPRPHGFAVSLGHCSPPQARLADHVLAQYEQGETLARRGGLWARRPPKVSAVSYAADAAASFTLTGQDDLAPGDDDAVLDPVDLDQEYVLWAEPRATALKGIDENWFPIYQRVALHTAGQNERNDLPSSSFRLALFGRVSSGGQ